METRALSFDLHPTPPVNRLLCFPGSQKQGKHTSLGSERVGRGIAAGAGGLGHLPLEGRLAGVQASALSPEPLLPTWEAGAASFSSSLLPPSWGELLISSPRNTAPAPSLPFSHWSFYRGVSAPIQRLPCCLCVEGPRGGEPGWNRAPEVQLLSQRGAAGTPPPLLHGPIPHVRASPVTVSGEARPLQLPPSGGDAATSYPINPSGPPTCATPPAGPPVPTPAGQGQLPRHSLQPDSSAVSPIVRLARADSRLRSLAFYQDPPPREAVANLHEAEGETAAQGTRTEAGQALQSHR